MLLEFILIPEQVFSFEAIGFIACSIATGAGDLS
jgi:hypothetical protein